MIIVVIAVIEYKAPGRVSESTRAREDADDEKNEEHHTMEDIRKNTVSVSDVGDRGGCLYAFFDGPDLEHDKDRIFRNRKRCIRQIIH